MKSTQNEPYCQAANIGMILFIYASQKYQIVESLSASTQIFFFQNFILLKLL
jgi:hypothetical protein